MSCRPQVDSPSYDKLDHPLTSDLVAQHPHHQSSVLAVGHSHAHTLPMSPHRHTVSVVTTENCCHSTTSDYWHTLCPQADSDVQTIASVINSLDPNLTHNVTAGRRSHGRVESIDGSAAVRDEIEDGVSCSVHLKAEEGLVCMRLAAGSCGGH